VNNRSEKDVKVADDAPTDNDTTAPEAGAQSAQPKGRRSFSRMRREMTDEELGNSGVQKVLMDDLDRLERENGDLRAFVDRFHEADKDNAVLKERAKYKVASDVAFGGFMTIGSAAIGYSPSLSSVPNASQIIFWAGVALLIAGLVSKGLLK